MMVKTGEMGLGDRTMVGKQGAGSGQRSTNACSLLPADPLLPAAHSLPTWSVHLLHSGICPPEVALWTTKWLFRADCHPSMYSHLKWVPPRRQGLAENPVL